MRYDPNNDYDGNFFMLQTYNERRDEYYRLYNIIHGMLIDKDDDEEIDFTKLFNKSYEEYNIGEIDIDRQKENEKYEVLVISGSNRIDIGDGIFISKSNSYDGDIVKLLSGMSDCIVHKISSNGCYDGNELYTIDELFDKLKKITKKKIDLVIDFTHLFDYQILDGKINIIDKTIDLSKLFPNSIIFTVKNIQDEIDLCDKLENIFIKKKVRKDIIII